MSATPSLCRTRPMRVKRDPTELAQCRELSWLFNDPMTPPRSSVGQGQASFSHNLLAVPTAQTLSLGSDEISRLADFSSVVELSVQVESSGERELSGEFDSLITSFSQIRSLHILRLLSPLIVKNSRGGRLLKDSKSGGRLYGT